MRLLLVVLLALPVAAVGCGPSETKPNPELKVPEVPPGGARSQPKDKGGK